MIVVGLGARRGVPQQEVGAALDAALRHAGLRAADVAALATVEQRAREAGVRGAAACRGWPVLAYPAGSLAGIAVPHPSPAVRRHAGTPSVAEAAALLAAGPAAELIEPKRVLFRCTVAIARRRGHG
jgi:histidinol-phosphate aminotransferase